MLYLFFCCAYSVHGHGMDNISKPLKTGLIAVGIFAGTVLALLIMAIFNNGELDVTPKTYGINETINLGRMFLTVTNIETSDGDMFYCPEEGNKFVAVNFAVQNNTDNDIFIDAPRFFISFAEGKELEWAAKANAFYTQEPGDSIEDPIPANKMKLRAFYCVEVPNDTKTLLIELAEYPVTIKLTIPNIVSLDNTKQDTNTNAQ